MTSLILVRHGQGLCNIERTIEGVSSCRGLTEIGRDQAERLAQRLLRQEFCPDTIVASPIRRARETAEIIANALGQDLVFESAFEEVRPGEAEGMTWDQYSAYFGTTEGWDPNVPFAPGAEAWNDFAKRVSTAIDGLTLKETGKKIMVVAHGGIVDASIFHFFGLDPKVQSPIDFETRNTSLTEWERRTFTPPGADEVHRWRLVRYNDAAHLDT